MLGVIVPAQACRNAARCALVLSCGVLPIPDPLALVTVSRKTPRDGKLEIPEAAFDRLTSAGPFLVAAQGQVVPGTTEVMPCTCARAAGAGHVHWFLVSDVLRGLAPEWQVAIRQGGDGVVTVEPVRPGAG